MILRFTLLFSLLFCFSLTSAQNRLQLGTQYFNQRFIVNPAEIGSYADRVKVFYTLNSTSWGVKNAPTYSHLQAIVPYNNNMTFGLSYLGNSGGIFTINRLLGNFSYKIEIGEENYILAGLSVGFFNDKIDTGQIEPSVFQNDEILLSYNGLHKTVFDADIGFKYVSPTLSIGLALVNLKKYISELLYVDQLGLVNAYVEYTTSLSERFSIKPLVMVRLATDGSEANKADFGNMQFDVGAKFSLDERFSTTFVYKTNSKSLVSAFSIQKEKFGLYGGYHMWFGDFGRYFGGAIEFGANIGFGGGKKSSDESSSDEEQ